MNKERKLELSRKIGLMGLKDLRKIAPIGDLDYENGWETYWGKGWMHGGMEKAVVRAAREQGFKCDGKSYGYRGTDHETRFPEIGLVYHTDSSD